MSKHKHEGKMSDGAFTFMCLMLAGAVVAVVGVVHSQWDYIMGVFGD